MLGETIAPFRVLIAEDETITRMDLRGLLEMNGFKVVAEAADGAQAVELARTTSPDVAILDLRMPGLDGVEAARRIYAERPVPILMLTAFSDRANIEDAIVAGVFSYLVKPFRRGRRSSRRSRTAVARHAELLSARRTVGGAILDRFALRSPALRDDGSSTSAQPSRSSSTAVSHERRARARHSLSAPHSSSSTSSTGGWSSGQPAPRQPVAG